MYYSHFKYLQAVKKVIYVNLSRVWMEEFALMENANVLKGIMVCIVNWPHPDMFAQEQIVCLFKKGRIILPIQFVLIIAIQMWILADSVVLIIIAYFKLKTEIMQP